MLVTPLLVTLLAAPATVAGGPLAELPPPNPLQKPVEKVREWKGTANNTSAPPIDRYTAVDALESCVDQVKYKFEAEELQRQAVVDLVKASAAINTARTAVANNTKILNAAKTAVKSDMAAKSAVDAAMTAINKAEADIETAKAAIDLAKAAVNGVNTSSTAVENVVSNAVENAIEKVKTAEAAAINAKAAAVVAKMAVEKVRTAKPHAKAAETETITESPQVTAQYLGDAVSGLGKAHVHLSTLAYLLEIESTLVGANSSVLEVEAWDAVLKSAGCNSNNVICLREDGTLTNPKALPSWLEAGESINVRVFGPASAARNRKFNLTLEDIERSSRLLAEPPKAEPSGGTESGTIIECSETVGLISLLASQKLTVTKKVEVYKTTLGFENAPEMEGGSPPIKSAAYSFMVDHGRYWVDGGLLVAFVLGGDKKVVGSSIPGTMEHSIGITSKTLISPVVALNVYPFGKRRGRFGPADIDRCYDIMEDDRKKKCKKRNRRRTFGEMFGLQVGIDVANADLRDQFFFGSTIEVINGFGISLGTAVVEVETIESGLSPGLVVSSEQDLVADKRHVARFYMGFTASVGIINAARALRDRIKELKK